MIFMTGATGFLGREMLAHFLHRPGNPPVGVLVRPAGGKSAEQRLRELLRQLFPPEEAAERFAQIRIFEGNAAEDCFGLGAGTFAELAAGTSEVFHCAASTNLAQPLPEARAINVGATAQALEFARAAARSNPGFARFHHVSTAYVAGDTERTVLPGELNIDGPFRNFYEQSKAEAEQLVRSAAGEVPVRIYRPSVIVGSSKTGATCSFNMLYVPARLFVRGLIYSVPASQSAPFDIVPVDYAASAIAELSTGSAESGACYHICAGVGRESTPWEIVETLITALNQYCKNDRRCLPLPKLLTPEMLSFVYHSICVARTGVRNLEKLFTRHVGVLRQILPFFPYMIRNPRFDVTATSQALGSHLGPAPLFRTYAEKLFTFCFETDWGKLAPEAGKLPQPS